MAIPPLGPGAEPPRPSQEIEIDTKVFSDQGFPLVDLPTLRAIIPKDLQEKMIAHNSIDLDPESQNSENIEKMKSLAQSCNNLTHFIRHHPLLTSGLVAGVLFIISAVALTTAVALGHTSIHILGADIPLNLEVSAVLVYQGVFLVNMVRRAAQKDEIELKIEKLKQEKIEDNLHASGEIQQYLREVTIGKNYYEAAREMRRVTFNLLREEYEQAILNRSILAQNSDLLTTLSPEDINLIKEADKIIRQCFDQIDLTETPEIKALTIALPDHPTDRNLKNKEIAASLGKKLAALFEENAPLFLRTKTSKLISFSGLAFLALSGIGIYFWLKGITGIPLFEHLGIGVLAPMAVYGLALFYEGYNSGKIDFLEKQKQALDQKFNIEDERFLEEKARIKRVVRSATEKIEKFYKEWSSLQETEKEIFELAKRQFVILSQLSEEKIGRGAKTLIAKAEESVPPFDSRRAVDFLSAPANGVELISTQS